MRCAVGIAIAILAGACPYNSRDLDDPDAGGGDDDDAPPPIDAQIDPTCAELWPYRPSNFEPCPEGGVVAPALVLGQGIYEYTPVTGALLLDGAPFMTLPTTGTSPRILAIAGLDVQMGAFVHVAGTTPLIIAVHGNAQIAGTLDVSAVATTAGPGGDTCIGFKGEDGTTVAQWSAGGGAGGGAFGSIGAAGGNGDAENGQAQIAGGAQMQPVGEVMLVPLRGGCRGGSGGEEDPRCESTGTPGTGGGGGGAIQVSARDGLMMPGTGQVAANGGGGGMGVNGPFASGGWHVGVGGGGGGSGGGILLEGATVTMAATAMLCANGGGGGGGTHNNDGPVSPGSDGICVVGAAPGGEGETGNGGFGGFATTDPGAGLSGTRQDDGGGGGGGGAGRIRVRAAVGSPPSGFVSTPPAFVDGT
jgi:hypothetical protein